MKVLISFIFTSLITLTACGLLGSGEDGPPRTIVFAAQNNEEGTFQIFSMWEDGPVSYRWSIPWEGSSTWQNLGTSSTQTVFVNNGNDFTMRLDVQDSANSYFSTRSVTVTL